MSPMTLGLIRHALTVAGGGLVTAGWLSSGDLEIAAGAVAALAGIAWSVIEKRGR